MIGFDYARTFNPAGRLGSASGIVNVGGFTASILLIIGIGAVLDALTPAGAVGHPLGAFRWAFALQYVLWAVGAVQVLRYRNAARRRLALSARQVGGADVLVQPVAQRAGRVEELDQALLGGRGA
jgi:hypothetical protein